MVPSVKGLTRSPERPRVTYESSGMVVSSARGAQLLFVGERVAAELAAWEHLVRAHAPQRRRVRVDGHGGRRSGMADAVDLGRAEPERLTGRERTRDGRAAEHEPFLGDLSADHRHGPRGKVVV